MQTASHLKCEKLKNIQSKLNFENDSSISDVFRYDLVEAFTKANIPLYKLQNPHLKKCIVSISQKRIKDESFYRKFTLNNVYANHIKKLKNFYAEILIYLIFDETIDASRR
jgi:hypothetical protein